VTPERDESSPPRRKPLRRDAEANLERVLEAAAAVFSEHGWETSIEEVARRAQVGLGTVYRRFENKTALVDELARRLLEDVVRIAERHLDDPGGTGLVRYLWEIGELLAGHSGLVGRMWNVPGTAPVIARSRELQGALLAEAQRHRLVRDELTAEDVAVALWSVQGVLDVTRGTPVIAWRRHLEVVIEGLRPTGRVLSNPPLTPAEMDVAIRDQRPPSAAPLRDSPVADGPRARRRQDARNSAGRSGGASASAVRTPSAS
jgi:AcrR family transcriptional regulator